MLLGGAQTAGTFEAQRAWSRQEVEIHQQLTVQRVVINRVGGKGRTLLRAVVLVPLFYGT